MALTVIAALLPALSQGQIRSGSIAGRVDDPSGAPVPGCRVEVVDRATGHSRLTRTDAEGRFAVAPVPHGRYRIVVAAPAGLADGHADLAVVSNLPARVRVRLSLARLDLAAAAAVPAPLESLSTRSETRLDDPMAVLPAHRATSLSALLASAPGVARGHNALVHVRGVEDGMLYVIDGVPVTERYDLLHASAIDVDAIESLSLVTGNLPAEFGGRSGAVVAIDRSADRRRSGYGRVGAGNLGIADAAGGAGATTGPVHWSMSGAGSASDRALDPVAEGNHHNRGRRYLGALHAHWVVSGATRASLRAGAARSALEVPNDMVQHLAGQDQRQRLDDQNLAAGWQHAASDRVVADAVVFHRRYASRLTGSPFDVPITARSDRRHVRTGALASVTHQRGRHLIKAGLEASRVAPDERFSFAITDVDLAQDRDVSGPALEFDAAHPFVFAGRRVGSYAAAFIQDELPLGPVRVDGGLRVERASLPRSAWQLSPRLGAAVALPRGGTVARASFNRLFMPPHVEHLLLASSEQARRLSPFAGAASAGGADVRPERVTSLEAGLAQPLGAAVALDIAYWDRRFTDVADPNVFFNTTIVFPNSVASGRARGVDVRATLRERAGVSGFVNYTHSRVDNTGPITGGLFLTDEFLEIGPGTVFQPDHDQPHLLAVGARVRPGAGRWWLALDVRHGGGGPLEVEDDDIDDVVSGPGGDLIDAGRGRMKPWTVVDAAASMDVWRGSLGRWSLRADVQNALGTRFAYTVGNPFEGTRFGHPRMLRVGVEWRWAGAAAARQ